MWEGPGCKASAKHNTSVSTDHRVSIPLHAMAQQAQGKTFHYRHYRLFRDKTLGTGAYGQVCKAKLDELPCAAKLLHPILVDWTDPKNQTNLRKFEQECRFLREIRHPNIVQYLAEVQDRESGLPVLLMELMDTSLTHFLERSEKPLPYHVQVDISHNIALALAYLHRNDIIHCDLSSNNILLIGPGYRAKVTDFGMSKLSKMHPHMTPLTKCPGTAAYMAPEALQDEPLYNVKLDVFQAGVLMIQIIPRKFPDPDRATRRITDTRSPTGVILMPVLETERRQNHLSLIPQTHPMLRLSLDCLKDRDKDRPTAQQVCQQLATLKEAPLYVQSHQEGGGEGTGKDGGGEREVDRREREREGEIGRRVTEVGRREREVGEREGEIRRRVTEAERREREFERRERLVDRREEGVGRREREVERREREVQREVERREEGVGRREREVERREEEVGRKVTEVETQLREEREQHSNEKRKHLQLLAEKDHELRSLSAASYTCHVSGPGLSATANYPTHVIVELSDASGQPCSLRQNVTAELQSVDQSSVVPTSFSVAEVQLADTSEPLATTGRWPWSKKKPTPAATRSVCQYKVFYTALGSGQHKLHVRLNGSEVSGSPFNIIVYRYPTQLGTPLKVVTGLNEPYGIAINSHGEMVVSNFTSGTVSLLYRGGKQIQTYGSEGDIPDQMRFPTGVGVDSDDNVYVASYHKLQKFSRDGHLIKCVGQHGSKDGEFKKPQGVRLYCGCVYVCDRLNYRIQVFDTDLNFIQTIGSPGSGLGQFNEPYALDFDSEGKAYISDNQNHRIQVIDTSGQFVQQFGQEEGEGKLERPTAVHVMGQFVYVSNEGCRCIAVYHTSGQFVISFRMHTDIGSCNPYDIASDCNGLIYVPDFRNSIHIFQ